MQAGGIDADVITLIPDLAARLVQQGDVLEPINSIVKKVGVHPSASHNYIRKSGNLYGLSIVEVAFGLLYNKALLDKAGIKKPATDPQEWLQQTIKLTNKPNQFGLYQPNTMAEQFSFWFTLQDWACAYDAKWAIGKKPNLTDPKVIKVLTALEGVLRQDDPAGLERRGLCASLLERADRPGADRLGRRQHHQDDRPEGLPEPAQRPGAVEERQADLASAPALDRPTRRTWTAPRRSSRSWRSPTTWRSSCAARSTSCQPFPEILEVKGMKKWLDGLKWSTGYRAIKPQSQLDVEGDFVYHDTEFGQIILTNYQRALTGSTSVESAMADAQKQAQALADRVF